MAVALELASVLEPGTEVLDKEVERRIALVTQVTREEIVSATKDVNKGSAAELFLSKFLEVENRVIPQSEMKRAYVAANFAEESTPLSVARTNSKGALGRNGLEILRIDRDVEVIWKLISKRVSLVTSSGLDDRKKKPHKVAGDFSKTVEGQGKVLLDLLVDQYFGVPVDELIEEMGPWAEGLTDQSKAAGFASLVSELNEFLNKDGVAIFVRNGVAILGMKSGGVGHVDVIDNAETREIFKAKIKEKMDRAKLSGGERARIGELEAELTALNIEKDAALLAQREAETARDLALREKRLVEVQRDQALAAQAELNAELERVKSAMRLLDDEETVSLKDALRRAVAGKEAAEAKVKVLKKELDELKGIGKKARGRVALGLSGHQTSGAGIQTVFDAEAAAEKAALLVPIFEAAGDVKSVERRYYLAALAIAKAGRPLTVAELKRDTGDTSLRVDNDTKAEISKCLSRLGLSLVIGSVSLPTGKFQTFDIEKSLQGVSTDDGFRITKIDLADPEFNAKVVESLPRIILYLRGFRLESYKVDDNARGTPYTALRGKTVKLVPESDKYYKIIAKYLDLSLNEVLVLDQGRLAKIDRLYLEEVDV